MLAECQASMRLARLHSCLQVLTFGVQPIMRSQLPKERYYLVSSILFPAFMTTFLFVSNWYCVSSDKGLFLANL